MIEKQIKITDVYDPTIYAFRDHFELMRPPSARPPEIPGYNLSILICIVGVISVILVKK